MRARFFWKFLLLGLLAFLPRARAHRLDDLLQAALIDVTPAGIGVWLHLNPGAEMAERVIWMMDRNGDRAISATEAESHARTLLRALELTLDDRPVSLEFVASDSGSVEELQSGAGNIHIELRSRIPALRAGTHRLRFENRYLPEISAYLGNGLLPKDPRIKILGQKRNDNQSALSIDFFVEVAKGDDKEHALSASVLAVMAVAFCGFICSDRKGSRKNHS